MDGNVVELELLTTVFREETHQGFRLLSEELECQPADRRFERVT